MENETTFNPYAAPKADLDPPVTGTSISARAAMLKYEVAIQSVGTTFFFVGLILVVAGMMAFDRSYWIGGLSSLAGATLVIWVGYGLKKLRGSARTVGMTLAGIGLVGFPVITLLSLHILFVLGNKASRGVFTPDYARIIAATPHIRHKGTPIMHIVRMVFAALVLVIALPHLVLFVRRVVGF